jgi:hypothetical protein
MKGVILALSLLVYNLPLQLLEFLLKKNHFHLLLQLLLHKFLFHFQSLLLLLVCPLSHLEFLDVLDVFGKPQVSGGKSNNQT